MDTRRRGLLTFLVLILFTVMACTIDFGGSDEPSKAEQTLQALQIEQTLEALDDLGETGSEEASAKAIPTKEIVHSDIPDEPGWVSQWWIETDSSSTASQKKANGGDFFNQNLLERPFTAQEMEYRQRKRSSS